MSKVAFVLAAVLAGHGLRKRSLSPSGATAAFIVGFCMMSVQLKTFGYVLIAFYLLGSRATKVGTALKQKLEEGHDSTGGGYRTAWQVFCNSSSAFICAVIWDAIFSLNSTPISRLPIPPNFRENGLYNPYAWCAVGAGASEQEQLSRKLVMAAMAHFACCLGDTFASELGILSKSPPRLITTLKVVPPGTNGGISTLGTAVSVLGGFCVSLVTLVCLLIENPACRKAALEETLILRLLLLGSFSGFIGSMLDSLLGATLQRTRYSRNSKKVLLDESPRDRDETSIGGLGVLSNNQVNLVSSIVTSVFVFFVA